MPDLQELREWLGEHTPNDNLIYKEGYWHQAMFVRDTIAGLLMAGERCDEETGLERYQSLIKVVSSHRSKSVLLPVYRINWHGIEFTMRDNFHGWWVSVNSEYPLDMDFEEIFYDPKEGSHVHPEGFPSECIYGPYSESNQQFTVEFGSQYSIWFFFYKIKRFVLQREFEWLKPYDKIRDAIDNLPDKWKQFKYYGDDTVERSVLKAVEKCEAKGSLIPPYGRINTTFSLAFKYTKGNGVVTKSQEDLDIKKEAYLGVFGTVPNWLTELIEGKMGDS